MSSKRPAGASLDARPAKRPITSSPEEGELDDGTPPPPSAPLAVSSPQGRFGAKPGTKVPFPFKKKNTMPDSLPERPPPSSFSGTNEDEDRNREDKGRRDSHSRTSRSRVVDHWAPGYDENRVPPRPQWDQYSNSRYDDDRSYRPRADVKHWEPRDHAPQGLVSPRQGRRSRSPSSPRSRSPMSPESTGKEKHRLPRPTLVEPDRRVSYDDDDLHYSRGKSRDRYHDHRKERSPNGWAPDSYRPIDDDMHYRREDVHDRWRRPPEEDRRYSYSRDYDRPSHNDSYHPLSPRSPVPPLSPPRSPLTDKNKPLDPIDSRWNDLDKKPDILPSHYGAVKIALPKKPLTPKRSPVSLLNGKESNRFETVQQRSQANGESSTSKTSVPPRSKHIPVLRTREEEKAVYGRVFEGCGLQSDYDVLMKLGEGTFGCVRVHIVISPSVVLEACR
jgi:serine/threonine-protein kinase BUR1